MAFVQVALNVTTRVGGFCSLTWATAVIFGGFAQSLQTTDFIIVFVLLLLEAIRFALTSFGLSTFFRWGPGRMSFIPSRYHFVIAIHTITFIALRRRLQSLPLQSDGEANRLVWCLQIFYALVMLNSGVGWCSVLFACCRALFPSDHWFRSPCLQRYYEKVVSSGFSNWLLETCDISFFFKLLSEEYRRRIGALAVSNRYRDLLEYLFCHEKAFEAVCSALDSTDVYDKEAAVNTIGHWTRWGDSERRILCVQRRLLAKLASMVDSGEIGQAAASCFQLLVKVDLEMVLEVETESREKLVDILIHNIHNLVKAREYDKTPVNVKTLIPLLEINICRQQLMANALLPTLAENLRAVFSNSCLKRSKAVAGYALRKINPEEPTREEVARFLREPEVIPGGGHVLDDEERYLLELLEPEEWPSQWRVPPNNLEVQHSCEGNVFSGISSHESRRAHVFRLVLYLLPWPLLFYFVFLFILFFL